MEEIGGWTGYGVERTLDTAIKLCEGTGCLAFAVVWKDWGLGVVILGC